MSFSNSWLKHLLNMLQLNSLKSLLFLKILCHFHSIILFLSLCPAVSLSFCSSKKKTHGRKQNKTEQKKKKEKQKKNKKKKRSSKFINIVIITYIHTYIDLCMLVFSLYFFFLLCGCVRVFECY